MNFRRLGDVDLKFHVKVIECLTSTVRYDPPFTISGHVQPKKFAGIVQY